MDRLFLDANVLFSAAYRDGAGVARLWQFPGAELVTSSYAVDEARRNLDEAHQLERLEQHLARMEIVEARSLDPSLLEETGAAAEVPDEIPQKDLPIIAGALEARATHLITGDMRDFGAYFGRFLFGVLVLPPGEYLRRSEE